MSILCVFLQLKEKIRCLEIGTPFKLNSFNNHKLEDYEPKSFSEDMTQDSGPEEEDSNEKTLEDLQSNCNFKLLNYSTESEEEPCDNNSEESQGGMEMTSELVKYVSSRLFKN